MKITDTAGFGRMIKERRKELGYTQKYICEVSGISASFISDLENGKSTIELGRAIYLANLLGIDIELMKRG
ncbi:MAG: helix-turn-helix transcriptional regulator [Lachnospiraceae bacterium]|nr:helix-turn-helix transcriptional regulator [Lachnospiraceae bacterium]